MGAGKVIQVKRAPTEFGEVNFTLTQPDDHSAVIDLSTHWRQQPGGVVLHLPWFADVSSVSVDGRPATEADGQVRLPPGARQVRLQWARRADAPDWSYDQAVAAYKQEYRKRYDLYMHGETAH
jgi:hypothetical protein